ncbi:hypothetical protein M23134_04601 [Microscilla marina ATCC 23134]|uniref:BioF2-like acetyltransferase domain-containing protein n=2 Tax=Microscilla marina TaxID=1027 RepID=A1ZTA1_MICM2|nr:hypothetical protein M23134_04601 [Microscilla marina ATCC 23134]
MFSYNDVFMKNYEVLINPVHTSQYQHHYPTYLYNTVPHLNQQQKGEQISFFLLHTKKQCLEATFHLFVQHKAGYSPGQAPFGGIEFAPELRLEVLQFFWQTVEGYLQKKAVDSIQIKLYAHCYHPENAQVLQYLWLQQGFRIIEHNLNYHININATPLSNRMHLSEKRRLRKCETLGYKFEVWTTPDFDFVHRFISQCRQRKGFPISLSLEAFQHLYVQFPQNFTLFTLCHQQRVIALATGVRVNADVLYYFLPADDAGYLSASPMVALLASMYAYGQQQGYKLFDLGISTEFSLPNHGLINFKKRMGAEASLKLTFFKQYG